MLCSIAILLPVQSIIAANERVPQQKIRLATDYLLHAQEASGGFPSFMCISRFMLFCRREQSVFSAALIAGVLTLLEKTYPTPALATVRQKALAFLRANKEPNRPLWRYWTKADPNYPLLGPDLDDTTVIAAVLQRNRSGFSDIRQALLRYRLPNGLFKTWADQAGETDCVVNANVLYYFALQRQSLPAVCAYLNRQVTRQPMAACSRYYAPDIALYYFYSRAYAEAGAQCLKASLREVESKLRQQPLPAKPLEQALLLGSLINSGYCGAKVHALVSDLLAKQQPDGSWPNAAFFKGPKLSYFGSAVLSTAIALESLVKYQLSCV